MNLTRPAPNWHTQAELEIPVGASTDKAIQNWLLEILAPLDLSPDFLGRVLQAAQDSTGHAFHAKTADLLSHLHVSILVPRDHTPGRKSWGFFHIERIEAGADDGAERHHAIDFYLYVEGD